MQANYNSHLQKERECWEWGSTSRDNKREEAFEKLGAKMGGGGKPTPELTKALGEVKEGEAGVQKG